VSLVRVAVGLLFAAALAACGGDQHHTEQGMMGAQAQNTKSQTDHKASVPLTGQNTVAIYTTFCSQCHGLPDPRQKSAAEWAQVMNRMLIHMKKQGKLTPSPQQQQLILEYLSNIQ